jgi:Dolichyl-phosphate-mannose-protein mannosyltransferase
VPLILEEQHRWRLDRWDALVAVGLVVFVAVLFLLFLERPRISDPLVYFYSAWHIDDVKPGHIQLRIGLIWPIWIVMRFFGYSELSYHLIPAMAAVLLVLSTWLFGRLLFGRWVGCLAGILIVYNPWVLGGLTEPLPDYLAVGLFTTAISILLWCWRTGRLIEAPLKPSTVAVLGLAGIACGWSYLAREFVVILFPLVPFLFYATRSRYAGLLPVASTALTCWLAELAWGMLKFGDPLARLHAASRPRTGWTGMFIETDPIDTVAQLPSIFLDAPGGFVIVALFLGGAAFSVVRSVRGDRRWQLIALWLIGGWLFFTTVAMLPVLVLEAGEVYLRINKFRYWAVILPPLFVAGLAFIQCLVRRIGEMTGTLWGPKITFGLASLTLILNATMMVRPATEMNSLVRNGGQRDYIEFREFISDFEGQGEMILLNLKGNPASRAIPIYLNSWNGRDHIWRERVRSVGTNYLKRFSLGKQYDLIVLDVTRSRGKSRKEHYPAELIRYLNQKFRKIFESSSGYVLVYIWPH